MDQETIIQYVAETFAGIEVARPTDGPGAGDTFFTYDPERNKWPFATIVTKNYDGFDEASHLERPGVYRLNVGVSRDTFRAVLGRFPEEINAQDYDYTALDRLIPHPVYATQAWVSVLNPSQETFELVKPLLAEAYTRSVARNTSAE